MEIAKVRLEGQQKKVSIPKKSEIQKGDYVKIIKISDEEQQSDKPLSHKKGRING